MNEIYEFALSDLDLKNKLILDAAIGAGYATRIWAEKIHKEGGTSKIIGVDSFDIPGEDEDSWKKEIEERLGNLKRYVEIRKANIFNLDFLGDESVDIINCDDTLVFLNPKPLKVLQALKEFKRVLKKGGILVIITELPLKDRKEGQWLRWNFAKGIYGMNGEIWSAEIEPEELKYALGLLNFEICEEKKFEAKRSVRYEATMNEWLRIMINYADELPYSENFRKCVKEEAGRIYEKVKEDGYLMSSPYYVIKVRKK